MGDLRTWTAHYKFSRRIGFWVYFQDALGGGAARFAKSMAMTLAAVPSRISRAPNCYRAQPIDFEELESHGDEPITEPSIFIGGERDSGKLR